MAFQRHDKQGTTLKALQQRLSRFDGVRIIPVKVTKVGAGQQRKGSCGRSMVPGATRCEAGTGWR